MARWKTASPYLLRHGVIAVRPHVRFAGLAVLAVALIWLLPAELFLPSLSVILLAAAGALSLLAWRRQADRHTDHVNLWDLAGAFAFIGFAAGMLSEPQHVMQLFGDLPTAR